MILDLATSAAEGAWEAQVCVVGGGTVGCYLAARLARAGVDVVLLEAGGASVVDGTRGPIQLDGAEAYAGATLGRGFGLGGTSALWGGVLVPLGPLDVEAADQRTASTWCRIADVVGANADAVRASLSVQGPSRYDEVPNDFLGDRRAALEAVGLQALGSEMLPFGRRNVARLVSGPGKGRLRIAINAVATAWQLGTGTGRAEVAGVTASAPSGQMLRVRAREFVVAAGTLESTRILLEIDRATEGRVLLGRADLGAYLSDHLSAPIGTFLGGHALEAVRLFAHRFEGSVLKSLRFVDRQVLRAGQRHFVHLAFLSDNPGFLLAKKVFAALQGRRMPRIGIGEVLTGSRGLTALAFNRFARRRLYVAPGTPVKLQLDVEQRPSRENTIRLTGDRDALGRWKAALRWRISGNDLADIERIQRSVIARWNSVESVLPAVHGEAPREVGAKLHDTYHPVGTCRMGADADAVVDLDLRVRGLVNLRVASTAVFPTAGCANPTFSILCFAESIANDIARR